MGLSWESGKNLAILGIENDNHIVWMEELLVWYKSGSLFYGRDGEKKVICVVLFSHCREKARNSQLLLEARSFLFFMVATKLVSWPPSSSCWQICLGRNIWQALGTGSEGPEQICGAIHTSWADERHPFVPCAGLLLQRGPANPQGRSVGPWVPLCEKSLEDTCRLPLPQAIRPFATL